MLKETIFYSKYNDSIGIIPITPIIQIQFHRTFSLFSYVSTELLKPTKQKNPIWSLISDWDAKNIFFSYQEVDKTPPGSPPTK